MSSTNQIVLRVHSKAGMFTFAISGYNLYFRQIKNWNRKYREFPTIENWSNTW